MTIEIELKYQLTENSGDNKAIGADISTMLQTHDIPFEKNENQLGNDYFDNDDFELRKMDFGLRIRSTNHEYEQTIKTAGKVIEGLHQRPEYNVDILNKDLDLSLFPRSIWSENINLTDLQKSLQVIFSTNFLRQTWLIHQDENIIELALDVGEISTNIGQTKLYINEIEIELVRGKKEALFKLAKQLKSVVNMELSDLSKAARGYSLYYAESEKSPSID